MVVSETEDQQVLKITNVSCRENQCDVYSNSILVLLTNFTNWSSCYQVTL